MDKFRLPPGAGCFMGRHTGDYLLGAVFLSAVFLFAMSHRTTESAIRPNSDGFQLSIASSGREFAPGQDLLQAQSAVGRPRRVAVIREISPGSLIVIGSLDVSGARHQVTVRLADVIRGKDDDQSGCLPVYRCSTQEVLSYGLHGDPSDSDLSSLPLIKGHDLSAGSHADGRFLPPRTLDGNPEARREPCGMRQKCSDSLINSRIFLTPHFGDASAVHEPVECQLTSENPRVRVYVDHRIIPQVVGESIGLVALQRLSTAVATQALPIVEHWIGAVADADGDQKLSIVVTDLDRHPQPSLQHTPIYGCIRESDFDHHSDFCGDIIYIDPGILTLPVSELTALLTHELTHAAICSRFPVSSPESEATSADSFRNCAAPSIPAWLNEAIAHFVELKCCEQSRNFQIRRDQFLANSSESPIVAAESVMSLRERRAGSRCAATWFLSPYFSSPQAVQQFLESNETTLDRRIAEVATQPFDLAFRQWTLFMAATGCGRLKLSNERLSETDSSARFSLPGTAFLCLECPADGATVIIESDATAQLQVSVVE